MTTAARIASAVLLGPSSVYEPVLPRDGATYDHAKDGRRLHKQHNRILALMLDGNWRSLGAIASVTKDPEASISARLRDLRKPRFGGYTVELGGYVVERRRGGFGGQHEYRVLNKLPLVPEESHLSAPLHPGILDY